LAIELGTYEKWALKIIFADVLRSVTYCYYPSLNSVDGENDSYVKLNVLINQWDYGTLNRRRGSLGQPPGNVLCGYLYQHETSTNADTQPVFRLPRTGFFEMSEAE
jgi:hypothetical protein